MLIVVLYILENEPTWGSTKSIENIINKHLHLFKVNMSSLLNVDKINYMRFGNLNVNNGVLY